MADAIEEAVARFEAGDLAGSRALLDALAIAPDTDADADRLELLGRIATVDDRHAEGRDLLGRALVLRKRLHGKLSAEAARGHAAIARHHAVTGEHALARRSSRLALKATPKDPTLLVLRGDLECVDRDPEAGKRSYKRALAKLRGADRVDALRGLGNVYFAYGNARKARKYYREALALLDDQESFAAEALLGGLGQVAGALGETDTAVAYFERELAILEATIGERSRHMAVALNNLAIVLADDDTLRAAAALQYAIAIGEHVYGDHPSQARALSNLAFMCSANEHPAMAIAWAERALAIQTTLLPADHIDILLSVSNLAHYERERGDDARARAHAERLYALAAQLVATHQETGAELLFSTGTLLLELAGDRARATAMYEQAIQLREALRGRKDEVILSSVRNAAARLFVAGAAAEAIAILEGAKRRARHPPFAALYGARIDAIRDGDRAAVIEDTELDDDDD